MNSTHFTSLAPEIIDQLREQLGAVAVLTGQDIPVRSANDWSPQEPQLPLALLRPGTVEGVSKAMKICHAAGIPVVAQGGMTGLCGGARPEPGCVALSLERLHGIEEIDRANASMTVKAGTTLEQIQGAAEDAGLYFALDLGARGSCTIGGNLSTNAGGNRVIRYGMARELVLGIEAVLPDGTVVTSLNKMIKNNAAYDIKQLFIGSEGTLGIITRAVLKLHAQPGCVLAAVCAMPSYDAVVQLLQQARSKLGPVLSAFEVMWPDYWNVITKQVGVRSPLSSGHAMYVLMEIQGMQESHDLLQFETWLEGMMDQGVLDDAAMARSISDVKEFWQLRDANSEFNQHLGPQVSYDIGLSVVDMNHFVEQCDAALAREIPGSKSVHYGHIGDGNMHIDVWIPGCLAADLPKGKMDEVIYGLVRQFKGTVSAEHGIGKTKKKWLSHARSAEEIMLMQLMKRALDPQNLLNPGKVL